VIVGVDEETGLIDDGVEGEWTVLGKGVVTVYKGRDTKTYRSSETFSF
jgi:cyanophycinase-like exopeptidase